MSEECDNNVVLPGPRCEVQGTRTLVVGAVARCFVAQQKFDNVSENIFIISLENNCCVGGGRRRLHLAAFIVYVSFSLICRNFSIH